MQGLSGNASLPVAAAVAIPSMVGARFGVRLSAKLSTDVHSLIFNGGSVLLLPTHFMVQRWRQQQDQDRTDAGVEAAGKAAGAAVDAATLIQHACFGVGAGVLSALMGVGGLPLTMSYLTMASTLPHHLIQGTSMVAVAPLAVIETVILLNPLPASVGVAIGMEMGCQ